MVPRENKNNAFAKFGGTKKSIMIFAKWPMEFGGTYPVERDLSAGYYVYIT